MKQIITILLLCLAATTVSAKSKITRSYHNESLSKVLELSLDDAIRAVIGFYPMTITYRGNRIFVECIQKSDHRLIGKLIDEQGRPVSFANIVLYHPADSTMIGGGVTNEAGDFVIPCAAGRVRARISSIGFKTMERIMRIVAEKYAYPVDVEYACNFTPDGDYRVNLLQCRTIQTQGLGQAGVMPQVRDFFWRIRGNFMGGNAAIPLQYAVFVKVEPYLALPESRKYAVARRVGELNRMLAGKGAVLIGPGRWGTTTPSLGVPVGFAEINNYVSMSELAYSSHGLRPELSYGSHFFQDLVETGIFYTAIYQGERGCAFNEALFDRYPDRYRELTGDERYEGVVKVYDLGENGAILYSEMESQECFLGVIE